MIRYESHSMLLEVAEAPPLPFCLYRTEKIVQLIGKVSNFHAEVIQYKEVITASVSKVTKDYSRLLTATTINIPIQAVVLFGEDFRGQTHLLILTPFECTREERAALLLAVAGEHVEMPRRYMTEKACAEKIEWWKAMCGIDCATGMFITQEAILRGGEIGDVTPFLVQWMTA